MGEAYLRLPHEDAVVFFTGEVFPALHGPIVLALGFIQDDTDPLPRGKQGGTNVSHGTTVPLSDDFYSGAHLQGLAAGFRAHPGAGAGRLQREDKNSTLHPVGATRRKSGLDAGALFPARLGSQRAVPSQHPAQNRGSVPTRIALALLRSERDALPSIFAAHGHHKQQQNHRLQLVSLQQTHCTQTQFVQVLEDRGAALERADLRG